MDEELGSVAVKSNGVCRSMLMLQDIVVFLQCRVAGEPGLELFNTDNKRSNMQLTLLKHVTNSSKTRAAQSFYPGTDRELNHLD